MQLTCPKCGSAITADNINVQTGVAKCLQCNEVFNFANMVGGDASAAYAKPQVEMPKGFSLTHQLSDLVITRTWFSYKTIFLLFFCLFWDGFLVVWYTLAFRFNGPLMMKVFPILHVAVGVFITYTMLAGFFNRTDITIGNSRVAVRHYPLPWPGNRIIAVGNLDQVFCEEKVSHSRNGTSVTYNVSIVLKGSERLTMISGLDQPNHALFIEEQIEGRLGIADRPVAGEMRPV